MTILAKIGEYVQAIITGLTGKPAAPVPGPTKPLDELLQFLAGFPYTQVAGAALAEGTNVPLDITAATAIAVDFVKAFYSGQSVQTATVSLAAKVGISPATAALIVYDPVHPADPMQFSRGR